MEPDIKTYYHGDKLKFKLMLQQRVTDFINTCHNPGGSGKGGEFCPSTGGTAGTPGGKRAGEIAGIPGVQLAAAKPSAAGTKYKTGDVTRLGFDTIPDDKVGEIARRITAIPGFQDLAPKAGEASKIPTKEGRRAILHQIAERQASNIEDMYDVAMQIDNGTGTSKGHADWYPWVNRWAHDEGKRLDMKPEAIMAATAALSPSTDWPSNVAWATQIANVIKNEKNIVVDKQWVASQEIAALASHEAKKKIHDRENAKLVAKGLPPKPFTIEPPKVGQYDHLVGKRLSELSDRDAAIAIRGAHEAFGKAVRQLGGMAGLGDPKNVAKPQSYPNMAKAISILRNPTPQNIDKNLGGNHKVRSFYQNMRDPLNTKEADVTVDSHHIGMAIGLPVTGMSTIMKSIYEAPKANATGLVGTYPITVEATRIATEHINKKHGTHYTPNQIQSISWEAQRALYDKKPDTMIEKIGSLRQDYWSGKITKPQMLAGVEAARLSGVDSGGKKYKNPTVEEVRKAFVKELKRGT